MPASYVPTKGIVYTKPPGYKEWTPYRAQTPAPRPTTPTPASSPVVPPPPEAPSLTKTSGALAQSPGQGVKGQTVAQREASSTAGLPFRDQTISTGALSPPDEGAYGELGDPQGSVISALSAMGYDPGSSNPAVKNLIDAAPAIEEAFVIQRVLAGGAGAVAVDPVEQARDYQKFVRDIVARGSFRQVAATAARGAQPAAEQLRTWLNTPVGQSALEEPNADWLRSAAGRLVGLGALPKTLSNLYEQVYNVPGEEAAGKAVQQSLGRAQLRSLATPTTSGIEYFRNFRP
jgi:hypothetical protein